MTKTKLQLTKQKKRLLFFGGIFVVTLPMLVVLLKNPQRTEAGWWNDSWQYRVAVPVTNNTTEENNIHISFNTGDTTQIDTSDTAKFQDDCGDLRFTTQGGKILPYYVVNGCGTANTEVNVFFDTFPAGKMTIYYYYGNPSAANGTQGSNFSTEATNYTIGSESSEEKTSGPIGYWPFDEGQGTTAQDTTPSGNDATLAGGTSYPSIEKQINIINQQITTAGTDTGIIFIDSTAYSNATYYFEVVARISSGTGSATLTYNAGSTGQPSGGSTVTITNISETSFTRYRSASFSPTNAQNAYVSALTGSGITINSARIIIEQPNAAVTATETQIEVGDNDSTNSTSAASLNNPKYFTYDHDAYNDGAVNSYFEATIKSTNYLQSGISTNNTFPATVTTYADAANSYNDQDWNNPTYVQADDGVNYANITSNQYDNGDYSYVMRVRNFGFSSIPNDATIDGVELTMERHYADEGVRDELIQLVNHSAGTSADRIGANQSADAAWPATDGTAMFGGPTSDWGGATLTPALVKSANFGVDIVAGATGNNAEAYIDYIKVKVYYSGSSSGTAYAELYNKTNTATVGNSTISTSTADWVRVRGTSALSTNWDTTNDDQYEVRIYSSNSGATTYITDAKVVIQQSDGTGLTTTQIIQQYNNTAVTDTDDSYSSQDYNNQFNPTYFTGGDFAAYFESTLKTSNGSNAYYAQLDYGGGLGEVTASDTGYTTKTSSDIWSSLPSTATDIDLQLKNAAASGTTTTSSNSWLKINATNLTSSSSDPPSWKSESVCISGKCLYFDGVAGVATVTNADTIDFDSNLSSGITFQTWIRASSDGEGNAGEIFEKGANTYLRVTNEGSDGYADLEASLNLETTPATITITNGINLNQWHNIAITYTDDGDDEIKVYIDGKLAGTSTNGDGSPDTDNNDLLIGGSSDNNFNGYVDEFKIYTSEKSAADIAASSQKNPSGTAHALGYNREFLSSGLVGYWKMDEEGENTCSGGEDSCDSSGNNSHGTWHGDTTNAVGKFGNSTTFDGTDDYISATGPDISTGDFTLSTWYNFDTNDTFRDFINNGGGNNFTLQITGGESLAVWVNASKVINNVNIGILENTWQHITLTYNSAAGEYIAYLNGQQKYKSSASQSNPPSSTSWNFGGDTGSEYISGELDEVRIYKRTLSPAEVQNLYEWAPEPVGYWKMDEVTSGTRYDSSVEGNHLSDYSNNTPSGNGKYGLAADFEDDTNNKLYITDAAQNDLDITGPLTISSWINIESVPAASRYIAGKWDIGTNTQQSYALMVHQIGTNFFVQLCINSSGSGSPTCTYGETALNENSGWNYLTGVYDSSNIRVYLNGIEDKAPTAYSSGAYNGTADFRIANSWWNGGESGGVFDGLIDEVKIYNYARTPSQILEDMNAGHPLVGTPVGSASLHMSFDEGYGNNANDQSINSNTGTISGALWSTYGKFDRALDYDGTDDVVTVTADGSINLNGKTEYTVCGWIYPDTDGEDNAGEWFSKGNSYIRVDNESGGAVDITASFDLATTDASYSSTKTINTGEWSHVCVTYTDDGDDEIAMYINGVLDGSSTMGDGSPADDSSDDLYIGGDSSNNFDGKIDELKIYGSAHTISQVMTEYNQGKTQVLGAISTDGTGATMVASNSAASSYCPPGYTTGYCAPPVAEWKFDEKTGTSAYDTSENNNTGTLTNGPIWQSAASCHEGACLEFDDSRNDYVNAQSGTSLDNLPNGNFTINAWVYLNSAVNDRMIAKKGNFTFWAVGVGGTPRWGVEALYDIQNANSRSTETIPTNEWHYFTAVYDNNYFDIFIDGIEISSYQTHTDGQGTYSGDGSDNFIIGSDHTGANYEWPGKIDNITIYDYARTPEQIAWEYNKGAPLGYWALDECQGTTAYDSSGNSYTGTITIGATGGNTSAGTCESEVGTEAWNNGTTGALNSSIDLDGTDDYISVTDNAVFTFSSGTEDRSFSISTWVYLDNANDFSFISKGSSSAPEYILRTSAAGYPQLWLFDDASNVYIGATVNGTLTAYEGTWTYLTATYDGSGSNSGVKIYINGHEQVVVPNSGGSYAAMNNETGGISIGRDFTDGSNYANGKIDEVKVFNYELTPQQVAIDYTNGAVRFK